MVVQEAVKIDITIPASLGSSLLPEDPQETSMLSPSLMFRAGGFVDAVEEPEVDANTQVEAPSKPESGPEVQTDIQELVVKLNQDNEEQNIAE